ncbi:hypothetical protein [Emticicia sp. TH156]|uniref:hypothetical protein n=1 Tax=Emticicia sp. TH156 TaxID=2067454 RepID=UPI000C7565C6|nr:hypothetical protein [Emticicia sp. TH156]PLK43724.1 hypothetical protein C0V77_14515 [Emticicia sp. TH156]
MSEEEKFHRIIREKLDSFQPGYSPEDWKKMQRKIKISSFLRFAIPGAVLMMAGLGFYLYNNHEVEIIQQISLESPFVKPENKPETVVQPMSKDTEAAEETDLKKVNPPVIAKEIEASEKNAENFKPETFSNLHINKLASRKLTTTTPKIHPDLLDKEIRYLNASAISMSDKILRVRQLGKTYELTSYQALDRNIEKWKNVVIVCDMTSSMFPYTTQVFDWITENADNTSVKGVVFFTDCDSLGNQTKGKLPGKMFMVKEKNEMQLWDAMFAAISNTENNNDKPENNIEALLYAQKHFPEADEIIMIADNSSPVKDMKHLSKVKKKTHIILCGETYEKDLAFQSDYVQIAKKTNGSIHTLEDDLNNPDNIKEMTVIRVGKIYFQFQKGKFYTTKLIFRP